MVTPPTAPLPISERTGEFSTTRKVVVCVGIALGLLGIPFMFWLTLQYRPRESGPLADVNWLPTGNKRVAHCEVQDGQGQALADVRVEFEGPTGRCSGATNAEGALDLTLGEDLFHTIRLNGQAVLERPHAVWLHFPSAEAGVRLRVVVKDVEALRAAAKP